MENAETRINAIQKGEEMEREKRKRREQRDSGPADSVSSRDGSSISRRMHLRKQLTRLHPWSATASMPDVRES